MHINSHRCTKRRKESKSKSKWKRVDERKPRREEAKNARRHSLLPLPPFTAVAAVVAFMLLLLCCATAVVVAIDQHGGARGQVTDKSKLWSITEHSLLQVSGVFSYV